MIAVIENGNQLCIVKVTKREGLRAVAETYCGQKLNAADGVVQVPDAVMTEGKSYLSIHSGRPATPCPVCKVRAR